MRALAAARALAALAPGDAAELIAAAVGLAAEGAPALAAALGQALLHPGAIAYDHLAATYAAGRARARRRVRAPRRATPAARPCVAARGDGSVARGVTLGHQKALARGGRQVISSRASRRRESRRWSASS